MPISNPETARLIVLSPDLPELRLLAQLAGVKPSALAAGFSAPENLLQYVGLEELARLKDACDRLAAVMWIMTAAAEKAKTAIQAKGVSDANR